MMGARLGTAKAQSVGWIHFRAQESDFGDHVS